MSMLISLGIMVGINIGIAFAQSYIVYIILRFCVALATAALFDAAFVFGESRGAWSAAVISGLMQWA